ncbi:MAG: hypothetical protein AAFY34_15080 [Pseudomonadota bacterium]
MSKFRLETSMAVFVVSAELGPLSLEFQREGLSGGFVTCVLEAEEIVSAIAISKAALLEDGYEILSIFSAYLFDSSEWEKDDEVSRLATSSELKTDVLYTTFEVYGS